LSHLHDDGVAEACPKGRSLLFNASHPIPVYRLPISITSAMLNHHRGRRMIDGIAIRSYRVGLAASQFSVVLCATCYANRVNWLGAFRALRFGSPQNEHNKRILAQHNKRTAAHKKSNTYVSLYS